MNERQKIMPLLGLTAEMKAFSKRELEIAKTYGDALYLTWKFSGRPRKAICDESEIAPETLSRMFQGSRGIPPGKEFLFFEACGNCYALQWTLYHMGFHCYRREMTKDEEIQYLRQQLMEKAS